MTLWEQINQPVTYAIPFFLLAMVLEIAALRGHAEDRAGYDVTDARASLTMGVVSIFVSGAAKFAALIGYAVLYVHAPWHVDPRNPLSWLAVMLGVDLLWYAYHRLAHRVRVVWAAHQVHHNSRYFNYATALRQKWNPWFELLAWVPLPLLGVPPWMIFTAWSFNLIYQFWVHTETIGKLPRWFEFVFNTPSHHRVHHASDREYLDRNYGGILILWDRVFGTFRAETFRPTYGLTKKHRQLERLHAPVLRIRRAVAGSALHQADSRMGRVFVRAARVGARSRTHGRDRPSDSRSLTHRHRIPGDNCLPEPSSQPRR